MVARLTAADANPLRLPHNVVVTVTGTTTWAVDPASTLRRLKLVCPPTSPPSVDLLSPLPAAPKFLEVDVPSCTDIGALPPSRTLLTSAWFRTRDAAAGARALAGGCPALTKAALVAADDAAPPLCLLQLAEMLAPAPRLGRLMLQAAVDAPTDAAPFSVAHHIRAALPRVRVLARGPVTPAAGAVLDALKLI